MALDFRRAVHLPKLRDSQQPGDPYELPRQRHGHTPQMHGRYPDYDVLEQADHWDPVTRALVLDRVENVPPLRFFNPREAATLSTLCDLVTAQDAEPRIQLLNYVDEKYFNGELDGYQYDDMPDDREAWLLVARGLDEQADSRWSAASFSDLDERAQLELVNEFSNGSLEGGAWNQLNVKRAFSLVMRVVLTCFYSHPWAWNEIGFGGPAYPRGYSRFGSPQLQHAERETWEGQEAFDRDPVRHRIEPPPQ